MSLTRMLRDEPQLQRFRAELVRRACEAFARSFTPVPPHLVASFRLWHYPAAGPHLSWVVFHPTLADPLGETPLVRRMTWDRDADFERVELGGRLQPRLEPALAVAEAVVDPDSLKKLMEEVAGLALPRGSLGPPFVVGERKEFGLEGFDREGRDGRPIVRIEWDRDPPSALKPVASWTDRVRRWLRHAMP